MRRYRVLVVVASAAAVWGTGTLAAACTAHGGALPAARAAAAATSSWGTAIEVPGLAVLNTRRDAEVNSVWCASAGNCVAGGHYTDSHGRQGFVAGERNGVWGKAIEVPGLAALNTGGQGDVNLVSCGAAGSCAAGGYYDDERHGFLATELHGRWAMAVKEPGLGALSKRGVAEAAVNSVSCVSAGNCAAGGTYLVLGGYWHGFVIAERNGRWGKAIEVPGLGALNKGGFAEVNSVSCASARNCAAGGSYLDGSRHPHGFVDVERNGTWASAMKLPGPVALDKSEVVSVSCASVGKWAAGGSYLDRSRHPQGFAVVEQAGAWGTAIEVPGLGALNKDGLAEVSSVSCAPAGTCAAGGYYTDRSRHHQGFVTRTR